MDNINKLIDEVIDGLAAGVVDAEIKFKMKINPKISNHFENVNITSLPMELDDGLHIKLDKFKTTNNEILNDVIQSSSNKTL